MPILELPSKTINLLKSSQVITSPASVIKELIENALDAEATVISVKLDNYGFDKIEVKDNGFGIEEDDVPLVAKPHFTSKITCFEDLDHLSSYGFRGEALSSLCSISDVTINTKRKEDSFGFSYSLNNNGNVKDKKPTAVTTGTSVLVQNLFKNIPVRRHFYSNSKRQKEEFRKVENFVMAFAVIQPKLHISLLHDKNVVFQKPASNEVRIAIHSIFRDLTRKFVYKECEMENLTFKLWLPKSLESCCSASSPDKLFICVNGRPVFHKAIAKVTKAYYSQKSEGAHGRYPVGVIFIEAPSNQIDVNLEPNKTRVLFRDEKYMLEILQKILIEIYGDVLPVKMSESRESSEYEDTLPCTFVSLSQSQASDNESRSVSEDSKSFPNKNSQVERNRFTTATKEKEFNHRSLSPNIIMEDVNIDANAREGACFDANMSEDVNIGANMSEDVNIGANMSEDVNIGANMSEDVNIGANMSEDVNIGANMSEDVNIGANMSEDVNIGANMSEDVNIGANMSEDVNIGANMSEDVNIGANMSEDVNIGANMSEDVNIGANMSEDVNIGANMSEDVNIGANMSEDVNIGANMSEDVNIGANMSEDVNTGVNMSENINVPEETTSTIRIQQKSEDNLLLFNTSDDGGPTKGSFGRIETPTKVSNEFMERKTDETSSEFQSRWSRGQVISEGRNIQTVQILEPPKILEEINTSSVVPVKRKMVEEVSAERRNGFNSKKTKVTPSKTLVNSALLSNTPVKKPESAFSLFAKHIRKRVIEDNPGADFTVIARELANRWKNADVETKQMYEEKATERRKFSEIRQLNVSNSFIFPSSKESNTREASSLKRFFSHKTAQCSSSQNETKPKVQQTVREKPWLKKSLSVQITLECLREKIKKRTRMKPSCNALIGSLKGVNGWIYRFGDSICALNFFRMNEVILFKTLAGSFAVPTIKMENSIPLNIGNLGDENWETLLTLNHEPISRIEHYIMDPRITSNGFKISLLMDSNSSTVESGEITNIAVSLDGYGIEDLKEVLHKLRQNPNVSLKESRPSVLHNWLKNQSLRMARASPHIRDSSVLAEKFSIWSKVESQKVNLDSVCLHGKTIFNVIISLEE